MTKTNNYTRTLAQINAGASLDELGTHLAALVKAVKSTGKGGEIIYKIKVTPASRGEVRAVKLTDDINVKMPRLSRPEAIFFTTEDGGLQRNDPNQEEMDLRVAPSPAAEPTPKTVNG